MPDCGMPRQAGGAGGAVGGRDGPDCQQLLVLREGIVFLWELKAKR
jgi:hypothetical protein